MVKKTVSMPPQSAEWNPSLKETWHFDLEQEPINDDKWTCVVTAAVPAKVGDDECIRLFSQSVDAGQRRAIKILSMSQVLKALKGKDSGDEKSQGKKTGNEKETKNRTRKTSQSGRQNLQLQPPPPPPRTSPIIDLAVKYANFADGECKLHPVLMAGVLKYMILKIKDENVFQKKVDAVRERKRREMMVNTRFLKNLKEFEVTKLENPSKNNDQTVKREPINDEPYPGPDLYIVLTDFYNPFYFAELQRVNVPFMALIKISHFLEMTLGKVSHTTLPGKQQDPVNRKEMLVSNFWKILAHNCMAADKTANFKNFLLMQYQPPSFRMTESVQLVRGTIFDRLSWMLYSVYFICREHQTYLQEMFVQRIFVALEPLDLNKCVLYNKLCDALVTGEPNTVFLVVYAMVEQVVSGVPGAESQPVEYEPLDGSEYFTADSEINSHLKENVQNIKGKNHALTTPCLECRHKVTSSSPYPCHHISQESVTEKDEWFESSKAGSSYREGEFGGENDSLAGVTTPKFVSPEKLYANEDLIDQVLQEIRMEKDEKQVKTSRKALTCFYGDKMALDNYHCDPRLLDTNLMAKRFMKNLEAAQLWSQYPEQKRERRAFYNFHFQRLLSTAKEDWDTLRTKIFFVLCMKLIGITNSYLYKGEEEIVSELFTSSSREKPKKLSKVKFDEHDEMMPKKGDNRSFSSCFFRAPFIPNFSHRKKVTLRMDNADKVRGSFHVGDSTTVRKAISLFSISLITHRNSGYWFSQCFRSVDSLTLNTENHASPAERYSSLLFSLVDCSEISNLTETLALHSPEDYENLVKNFNFYEALEPNRMIQNLMEAQDTFSTTQCSYFAPTDTLLVIMHNDSDHRGVFFHSGYGVLTTPVCLRDFYSHVYQEIQDWLVVKREEYMNFVAKIEREKKDLEEEKDKEYLLKLKREYRAMSKEQRQKYLSRSAENTRQNDFDVSAAELEELPVKPKPEHPKDVAFVTTNLSDLRIEANSKLHEYHSRDGSEINVAIESWLYEASQVLTLSVKQSKFRLVYHQRLEEKLIEPLCLRMASGIIFVFYKDERDTPNAGYKVKISWPTGLLIQGIFNPRFSFYIKQHYIDVYKRKWDIHQERSRHFLRNGQILIFYEDGNVDVLCPSGTKHILKEFDSSAGEITNMVIHYQTLLMTGEVWVQNKTNPCKNKRNLTETTKIYAGVDSKTQETYYLREDGVRCMLWPSGKLVTTFADGTKISSTPDFDSEEIVVTWTAQEKAYLEEIESSYKEEKPKSKAILKKQSPESPEQSTRVLSDEDNAAVDSRPDDGFTVIQVSYLMEHPRYATVHYDANKPNVEVRMPKQLSISMDPQGTYLVAEENNFLNIQKNTVEMYKVCPECGERSTATLSMDFNDEILCRFVDHHHTSFFVYRNGDTNYREKSEVDVTEPTMSDSHDMTMTDRKLYFNSCGKGGHVKAIWQNQRCFVLERNLSGIEFIHNESLAQYCYTLSEDAYYELCSESPTDTTLTHLFSNPHYGVGHETWVMEYEDKNCSLPTNLKKIDLKELGLKDNGRKLFKYPFPRSKDPKNVERLSGSSVRMPKIVETRIVKCLAEDTKTVIKQVKDQVARYQKKARDLCKGYKLHQKTEEDEGRDRKSVEDKLRKVGLALSHKWTTFPHVATQVPSTEDEIHRAGHYLNLIEQLEPPEDTHSPRCKQLSSSNANPVNFPSIYEDDEDLEDET